jgi:cytochrome c-type biogenesis protein CcmH/NrfG
MKHVSSLLSLSIPFLLAFLPLVFLPLTQDFYDLSKWTVLIIMTLFALGTAALMIIRSGTINLHIRPTTIAFGAIMIASITSLLLASPNKIEALIHPFGTATFVAFTLLALLSSSFWDNNASRRFLWGLFYSSALLGLISVGQALGIGSRLFSSALFLADPLWTPTGSALATAAILAITVPLLVKGAHEAHVHKRDGLLALIIIMILIVISGLTAILWIAIPKLSQAILPLRDGWAVMLEILKTPKQALFGVGAENFLTAFTAGRPAQMNMTPLWSLRFGANANLLLHLTTVYGLVGMIATLIFLRTFLSSKIRDGMSTSLTAAAILLLLLSPNLSLLAVCAGLLLSRDAQHGHMNTSIPLSPHWLAWSIGIGMLLFTVLGLYGTARVYAAEWHLGRAIAASQKNDGTSTYNLQVSAIRQNPAVARFHIINSQTSLALSIALARTITQQPPATEEELTANRNLIAQLVQQAIREAKVAVRLNTSNILAWEQLARTYNQLIGIAQGADGWAVTSYTQAMVLDPYNPVLSVELGSVYIKMKNYTEAITQFTRATTLKPDYANAWYNLAHAYRLQEDGPRTIMALTKTQSLVVPNSDDYRAITEELEEAKSPVAAPTQPETQPGESTILTTPAPTPVFVPPLDLGEEARP